MLTIGQYPLQMMVDNSHQPSDNPNNKKAHTQIGNVRVP